MIQSLEKTMIRISGPVNTDEVGKWMIGMREHYGQILSFMKHEWKRHGFKKGSLKNVRI